MNAVIFDESGAPRPALGNRDAASALRAHGIAAPGISTKGATTQRREGRMDKSAMDKPAMDKSARFWDRVAARYARSPVPDEAVYQKKLELSRAYFRPDMEVVELGCGTGSTAIAHAPFVKHIRATDISSNMLEIARRKADAADIGNVTFERCAIDALEVPARSVDAVLALSILHLVDDRDAVIARVHDMLKPGGVFISSTACLAESANWFRFIAPIGRKLGLLPLVRFFTKADLERGLRHAGFEIDHSWRPDKAKAVFIVARKAN